MGGVVVLGVQLRAQWITEGTGGSKKGETEYKFRNNGGHWAAWTIGTPKHEVPLFNIHANVLRKNILISKTTSANKDLGLIKRSKVTTSPTNHFEILGSN